MRSLKLKIVGLIWILLMSYILICSNSCLARMIRDDPEIKIDMKNSIPDREKIAAEEIIQFILHRILNQIDIEKFGSNRKFYDFLLKAKDNASSLIRGIGRDMSYGLKLKAKQAGFDTIGKYADFVESEVTGSSARKALGNELKQSLTFIPPKASFFDFNPGEVKHRIDNLIKEKFDKEDFNLDIKVIGASTGEDAVSIAILLHDRLFNFGYQNKDTLFKIPYIGKTLHKKIENWIDNKWNITIQAYEQSLFGLNFIKGGQYKPKSLDDKYSANLINSYSTAIKGDGKQKIIIDEDIFYWIKPIYMNFSDKEQIKTLLLNKDNRYDIAIFLRPQKYGLSTKDRRNIRESLRNLFKPGFSGLFIWRDPNWSKEIKYEGIE